MWTTEHTIVTDATKESIWKVWADVNHWSKWDKGLEWCRMDSEFKVGTTYALKPVGGGEVKSVITECQPSKRFADVTKLPLAQMEFIHELTEKQDGLHVTHRVNISGPLSFFFANVIGKDTEKSLPETMGNLARIAKESK